MQIKIALCDDDQNALPIIAGAADSAFRAKGIQPEIIRFSSGRELLESLEKVRYHIVLLDIEMPGMDGISVGRVIRDRGDNTPIIFVSECESRVFESFLIQPLGFVRKSNFLNDIAAVADLYIKTSTQESNSEYLEFATRSGMLTLKSKQIRYIEGSRNYQMLYTTSGPDPIEVKMTMDKLEAMTQDQGFIRIHKGYLVNFRFIQRIQTSQLTLQDGTVLPIGRSKMGEVKSRYLSLIGK